MLVLGFPAGPLQANCYVLAPDDEAAAECVVVDPGQQATGELRQRLEQRRLTPAAVVLTHGHFDHVASAAEVGRVYQVPVWIHPGDRYMLSDPAAALNPELRELAADMLEADPPERTCDLGAGMDLDLAGIRLLVRESPGHTAGSVLLHAEDGAGGRMVLTGDTVFAGAIGRTDLPGGDHGRMLRTLVDQVLALGDDTVVLPGHGATTTIGHERANNPFLTGLSAPTGRGTRRTY